MPKRLCNDPLGYSLLNLLIPGFHNRQDADDHKRVLYRFIPAAEFEWKGCPVRIYAACDYNNQNTQLVNWYGQLIPVSETFIPFGFLVTVRVGSPVNPKAPTREGLINDEAKEALMAAIKEAIFTQLCRNDTTVATLRNIKALYRMDNTRASQDCLTS